MLKSVALLALPLIPFAFLAGPAETADETARQELGVGCEVRGVAAAHGIRLLAIATADRAVKGEYRFQVEKRGRAGTSQTAQSGEFSLQADQELVLGEVVLGAGGDASYEAELVLRWNGRNLACRRGGTGSA